MGADRIDFIGVDKCLSCLGRKIYVNLTNEKVSEEIVKSLDEMIALVNSTTLSGVSKSWLYQFAILPRLTWPFLVYDLSLSFVERQLQPLCTRMLKEWLGVTRCATPDILYLSKQCKGLGFTSLVTHYKKMQIVRADLFKYSTDPRVRAMYHYLLDIDVRNRKFKWKPYEHHELAERAVELQRLTDGGQQGRTGLGYLKKRTTHPSAEEDRKGHRKAVTSFIVQEENDSRRVHLMSLAKQGKWSSWDSLMQQDLSWYRLLYDMPPNILKFLMNGMLDTLPSPVNLKLWHKELLDNCPLCNRPHCSMSHILSMCSTALKQGRYLWRHNLVLREFVRFLQTHLDTVNKSPPPQSNTAFISFVRAQKAKQHSSSHSSSSSSSSSFTSSSTSSFSEKKKKLCYWFTF
jgi:hypothetical protein